MIQINPVTALTRDGEVAVITVNHPPVNALSEEVRAGLLEGFRQANASDARAIVLICDGRTFIAGADISEFGHQTGPTMQEAQDEIEGSPKPVIAAIHGTALGGGLEIALYAHYRVAVPSAKVGLPEVNIGLLAGAGGTQRLPRIVGVQKALEMVTSGQHVAATQAAEMGLIDEIVPEGDLLNAAVDFARRVLRDGRQPVPVRDNDAKLEEARSNPGLFDEFRKANARKFRGFKAPEQNIKAVQAAVNAASFEEGIAEERRLFRELVTGSQSAAQRYYFFAERMARRIADVPNDTPTRPITKVGVLGGGLMGGGIAMNFINAGIPVTMVELKQEALDRGLALIRQHYERSRGADPAQIETRMSLLTGSIKQGDLADCDLIIEAVFEQMDIKKQVFSALDHIAKPGAILATNTSYLNVDEIASATGRPQDVIGLHFFSPANVMKLLEVVRGEASAKDVIATSMKLAKQIGKVAVLAGVCHGFIGNRMLAQRQRAAQKLVLEGSMPWDVDRVLYDFGLPMGPFAMADLAGLDLGWVTENSRSESVQDVLCEMGRRGQKTGAGYYDYDENRTATPSPVTEKVIYDFVSKSGRKPRRISDEEILSRCILPMINEGAKILEEGKAIRPSDIDVGWVNGYGWPVYRGGPMYYADQLGLGSVLAEIRDFQKLQGDDLKPAALLERLVAEGKKFSDFTRPRPS